MLSTNVISADSHFVEPAEMWVERMDKRFRDRAPHTVRNLDGKKGEFFVCEKISPMPVGGFWAAGTPAKEMPIQVTKGFDTAPASVRDPAARIKDQDVDGVRAEVIYPSMGLPLFGLEDADLRSACFRAFNDWAAEYCSYDFKRLIPLGMITLHDIPAAVKELQRIAAKGVRGALIWAEPPAEMPYNHPAYEPFWAAAQDLNMPLSLHILTSSTRFAAKGSMPRFLRLGVLHNELERTLTTLIYGGVLEKFPGLKIVSAENNAGWLPYLMYRLDFVQGRLDAATGAVKLPRRASDYVTRQFYTSFINDPVLISILSGSPNGIKVDGFAWEDTGYVLNYGADNIMWSSDYPHNASTFPRSRQVIEKRFAALSDEQRQKIVHDTVVRLYNLEG